MMPLSSSTHEHFFSFDDSHSFILGENKISVVLVCNFLLTKDFECLLKNLFAIQFSYFFQLDCLLSWYLVLSSLCIVNINSLTKIISFLYAFFYWIVNVFWHRNTFSFREVSFVGCWYYFLGSQSSFLSAYLWLYVYCAP